MSDVVPAGPVRIDLDAIRAARAEKAGPAPVTILGGHEYELPRGLPVAVIVGFLEAQSDPKRFVDTLELLFPGKSQEVIAAGLEIEDLEEIIGSYAGGTGESSASDAS